MTSEEWEELALAVALALKTFDWPRSDALCERIAGAIRSDPSGAAAPVGRILKRLRRARRFQSMALLADAMFESGVASTESGVQYAQALTDTRSVEDRNGARSPYRPERLGASRRCSGQVYSCRRGGCLPNRQYASPVDRGLGTDEQCAARISGSSDVARGASCSRRWRLSSGATSSRRGSQGICRPREGLRRRPV